MLQCGLTLMRCTCEPAGYINPMLNSVLAASPCSLLLLALHCVAQAQINDLAKRIADLESSGAQNSDLAKRVADLESSAVKCNGDMCQVWRDAMQAGVVSSNALSRLQKTGEVEPVKPHILLSSPPSPSQP